MRKKILLADDDLSVLKSLSRVLESEDYLPLPATNGKEVLEIAATNAVDLILLDLNMPVKTGWDTLSSLMRDHPGIPVIIITACPNQLFAALAAGAGALLEKPLHIPLLLKAIESLLNEPREARLRRSRGKMAEFHYGPPRQNQTTSL